MSLIEKKLTTKIENFCWVRNGVIVIVGIKISCGSIIAASAVVTIEIDSYLKISGKIIDEKLYPKNFFIRFNDGSIDTLFTETIFQKNDCGYSNIKDFTAKYNQRAIKSANNNLANNIEITIAKGRGYIPAEDLINSGY